MSTVEVAYCLCRRPETASADSQESDAESVLSASQHKSRPFVTAVKSQPACDKVSDWLNKDSYGQVPNYLIERQLEMAAQMAEEEVCTTAIQCAQVVAHADDIYEKDDTIGVNGLLQRWQTVPTRVQPTAKVVISLTGNALFLFMELSTQHVLHSLELTQSTGGAGSERCSKYSRGDASASRG